jgi:hypothetical protein
MDKNIVALLDTKANTVHVLYQHCTDADQAVTYVTNHELSPGDLVLVPTKVDAAKGNHREWLQQYTAGVFPDRISVAVVIQVDPEVTIEPQSPIKYKWVIGKICLNAYKETMARNEELEGTLYQAYKSNLRRGFAVQTLAGLPDEVQKNVLQSLGNAA